MSGATARDQRVRLTQPSECTFLERKPVGRMSRARSGADTVKTLSDRRAKARAAIAFLLLFVVAGALSVGVYYLGKLQENIAGQESRIALEAIDNATSIDEELARSPSNKFLKLVPT